MASKPAGVLYIKCQQKIQQFNGFSCPDDRDDNSVRPAMIDDSVNQLRGYQWPDAVMDENQIVSAS